MHAQDFALGSNISLPADPNLHVITPISVTETLDDLVPLLECNVFCGPYSVVAFNGVPEPGRVASYHGGLLVQTGSSNKKSLLWDARLGKAIPGMVLMGHTGSIKVLKELKSIYFFCFLFIYFSCPECAGGVTR